MVLVSLLIVIWRKCVLEYWGLCLVYLAIGDSFELDKIPLSLSVIFELLAD